MLSLLPNSVTYLESADALRSSVALCVKCHDHNAMLASHDGQLHQIAERTKGGAGSML